MRLNVVFFSLCSLVLTSCLQKADQPDVAAIRDPAVIENPSETPSQGEELPDNVAPEIAAFKLDDVKSMFRSSPFSQGNASSLTIGLLYLFTLLASGEYKPIRYLDANGVEYELRVEIVRFERLSERYVAIELFNSFAAIIDLANGSIRRLESYELHMDSLTIFGGWLFAYSQDLKSLKRIHLANGGSQTYLTLSGSEVFMLGHRFKISDANLFWGSDGNVAEGNKNFRVMMVDRNLNVMTNIKDPAASHFSVLFISHDGSSSQTSWSYPSNFISLYESGSKLYAIHSVSGKYTNLYPGSPTLRNVDLTLSEVTFSSAGLSLAQVQQIKPFATDGSYGSNYIRCRSRQNDALDSGNVYIAMGYGVLRVVSSNGLPQLVFALTPQPLSAVLQNTQTVHAPTACLIADGWLYYLNSAKTQILRGNLADAASFSSSVVVSRSDILSFDIVGHRLHYSTASSSYEAKLNGSDEREFTRSSGFEIENALSR